MRRVFVPFNRVRRGDVIEYGSFRGPGPHAVVTADPFMDESWAVVYTVTADGDPDEWRYSLDQGAMMPMFTRVGEGCTPTAEGLRDFIIQHRQAPAAP